MLIDITLRVTPKLAEDVQKHDIRLQAGHLGTHFDGMDREFPLEYARRRGYVFDVRPIRGREITSADVDLTKAGRDMFVGFCTGFLEEVGYGSEAYYARQPVLSTELMEALLERGVSIVGIDFPGVRSGEEHTPMDRHCADRGTFIVENLCGLERVAGREGITVYTFPVNWAGVTGLPCRVLCEEGAD